MLYASCMTSPFFNLQPVSEYVMFNHSISLHLIFEQFLGHYTEQNRRWSISKSPAPIIIRRACCNSWESCRCFQLLTLRWHSKGLLIIPPPSKHLHSSALYSTAGQPRIPLFPTQVRSAYLASREVKNRGGDVFLLCYWTDVSDRCKSTNETPEASPFTFSVSGLRAGRFNWELITDGKEMLQASLKENGRSSPCHRWWEGNAASFNPLQSTASLLFWDIIKYVKAQIDNGWLVAWIGRGRFASHMSRVAQWSNTNLH